MQPFPSFPRQMGQEACLVLHARSTCIQQMLHAQHSLTAGCTKQATQCVTQTCKSHLPQVKHPCCHWSCQCDALALPALALGRWQGLGAHPLPRPRLGVVVGWNLSPLYHIPVLKVGRAHIARGQIKYACGSDWRKSLWGASNKTAGTHTLPSVLASAPLALSWDLQFILLMPLLQLEQHYNFMKRRTNAEKYATFSRKQKASVWVTWDPFRAFTLKCKSNAQILMQGFLTCWPAGHRQFVESFIMSNDVNNV